MQNKEKKKEENTSIIKIESWIGYHKSKGWRVWHVLLSAHETFFMKIEKKLAQEKKNRKKNKIINDTKISIKETIEWVMH